MGEYEERYPDAYGRGDTRAPARSGEAGPTSQPILRPGRDRRLFDRLASGAGTERARTWQHRASEPTRAPRLPTADFRGRGPRNYVRPAGRIFEDICERLTENPFVDPSDIEVAVVDSEVILTGTVDSEDALRQVLQIADNIIGVTRVDVRLAIRSAEPATPPAGS